MPTDAEHFALYDQLRTAMLGRHFAYGRYFRADLLALSNTLGYLKNRPLTDPLDEDDPSIRDHDPDIARGSGYASADELRDMGPQGVLERWRVADHDRENPLMYSGQLLTCLAIEDHLGFSNVKPIIAAALRSIGALYKVADGPFKGYPIRWDPVTSDRWVTQDFAVRYCCEFVLNDELTGYLYNTPFQDPRYTRLIRNQDFSAMTAPEKAEYWAARAMSLHLYRRWELSQDELVGLVLAYEMVWSLVDDQEIKDEVARQVTNLSDYLAQHSYLLVRPAGGLNARGASGALPAMEWALGRVFERITGDPHRSRTTFSGALEKAGVWRCYEEPVRNATIAAVALTVVASALVAIVATVILSIGVVGAATAAGVVAALGLTVGIWAAQALAIKWHGDCLEVWGFPTDGTPEYPEDRAQQEELAGAFLLKKLPGLPLRLRLWWGGTATSRGWAAGFPPFLALTSLFDSDQYLARLYKAWIPRWRDHHDLEHRRTHPARYDLLPDLAAFPWAVAVALGDSDQEATLVERLSDHYGWFTGADSLHKRDLALTDDGGYTTENYRPALGYMCSLALAWLHAKRRMDAADPVPTAGFPNPPDPAASTLATPAVPSAVVAWAVQGGPGSLRIPVEAVRPPTESSPPMQLFPPAQETARPPEPPAPVVIPPAEKRLVIDKQVTVPESSSGAGVDTGVDLRNEDDYVIEGSGSISAGVWLTGENGPAGWQRTEYDTKFPVTPAPPYCLIGRLGAGSWFVVGNRYPGSGRRTHIGAGHSRIRLRTNDDAPGNGSKAFTARIRVWRRP